MRRKHPVRLTFMEEHRNADGTLWMPQGSGYANLAVDAEAPPPEGFYRHQPKEVPLLHRGIVGHHVQKDFAGGNTKSTTEKEAELRMRIRNKEKLKAKATTQVHVRLRTKSSLRRLTKVVKRTTSEVVAITSGTVSADVADGNVHWALIGNGADDISTHTIARALIGTGSSTDCATGNTGSGDLINAAMPSDRVAVAPTEQLHADASGVDYTAHYKKQRVQPPKDYTYTSGGSVIDDGESEEVATVTGSRAKKPRTASPPSRAYSG